MTALGFSEATVNWFKSYLSDRKQITDVDGTTSTEQKVNLGVPQGSILGPILFLIYVNDMNNSDQSATFCIVPIARGTNIEYANETYY